MTPFLSSTFIDLVPERKAVLEVLRKVRSIPLAMEDFVASARTPEATALDHLRKSDLMILLIGFKAGTLLPDGSGFTYTSIEYEELLKNGKKALAFVKQKKTRGQKHPAWANEETDPAKKQALEDFKNRVGKSCTWVYFTTPEGLALNVVLALKAWEDEGRPGARTTFASTSDYFSGKNPAGHFQILDFGTTLAGREDHVAALDAFAVDAAKRVGILSGKGGIGKSKLLFDWANARPNEVIFLRDEPLWHGDSEKEIPTTCKYLVVDDAHRHHDLGKLTQLLLDTTATRNFKLVAATRPGSKDGLFYQINQKVDVSSILQLPDLKELTKEQSLSLAEEVLGAEFSNYAEHLAVIGSNSPLVIVAGGRLIASKKINPSTLTNLSEFRSTIFGSLLQEMGLNGPHFVPNLFRDVLDLVAALGPINVEERGFTEAAEQMLARRVDEIFSTIDALVQVGVITPRPKPIRVIPDVLSDFLLEERCLSKNGQSTRFADKVYQAFGGSYLGSLMRNLSELDWRRGQAEDTSLNLLNEIWADIHQRFRAGDEYERHRILTELSGAAIYQPRHVIVLIRVAMDNPIKIDQSLEGNHYRAGQSYVVAVLPALLEATAHHYDWITESIDTLWELSLQSNTDDRGHTSAQKVLERLSSWHRYGDPRFNLVVLLQAIRLARRADAFTGAFTPFNMISQMLERDGEFNEWQDEMTMAFGGFGLNYDSVGSVRETAISYIEHALEEDGRPATIAVGILEELLHNHLNRMGRPTTPHEASWQDAERQRSFEILVSRFRRPSSPHLKAAILKALRSATAIYCPEKIRASAVRAFAELQIDDDVAVIDAISTAEHELPILSPDIDLLDRDKSIGELMMKGRAALERLIDSSEGQARFTIDQTQASLDLQMKTGGFHRFMYTFADHPHFLAEMADQLAEHAAIDRMVGQLASVMGAIRMADPESFRERALIALKTGAVHLIHAAANNLRVFSDATERDIAVIQAYGGYSDPVAKRGAIHAIAYMGKFEDLRESLKAAALSIHADGSKAIATELVDAFGPYGVPLTMLTRDEAAAVATEFLTVEDWEFDQGAIPRFLSLFVNLFPDETYDLLVKRIDYSRQARKTGNYAFRTFGLVHASISFMGVPATKREQLARGCIARLLASESSQELADLYWTVAGFDALAYGQILAATSTITDQETENLVVVIGRAIPKLIFTNPDFARELLKPLVGEQRKKVVEALAVQARRMGSSGSAGSWEDFMDSKQRQYKDGVSSFTEEAGFEDLSMALRRLM